MNALGYALQATAHPTSRQNVVFGGEIYDEGVDARRDVTDPGTGAVEQRRALYPNGSAYRTSGLFFQDAVTIVPDRIRAVLGGRYTLVRAGTLADRNRTDAGRALWERYPMGAATSPRMPPDSLRPEGGPPTNARPPTKTRFPLGGS